jgi:tetratricopeptide (TPR) repeat protein
VHRFTSVRSAAAIAAVLAGIAVSAALAAAAAAAAQPTPPAPVPALPVLTLESFPTAARAAIADARREAAARPDDATAVGRLGMVLHAWEQWQSAAIAYERARMLAPRDIEWPYLGAIVALRTGRVDDAVKLLDSAAAAGASASLPLAMRMKLAEALVNGGNLTRGAELYATLAKEPAAQPEAEYGLGRIAALKGDWKTAAAHQQRACDLFPEFGAAHYALGLAYRNTGRLDDAQRELALHRRYGPRWPAIDDPVLAKVNALKDDARANLERGIRLGNEGKLAEAIAAHDAALAKDPDNAQVHANLISLHGRLGQWADAEKHFKAVVALKSNLDEAYYNYGIVLTLQKRDAEAADAFRHAIDANPLHAQAYNNLGVLFERERRWEDAAGAYRHAIESQPAFRLGRFNLGRMLIALGRNDDAVVELEKLIALEPRDEESPRYVYALSTAHLRAGRVGRALEYAQEARRLALAYDQAALVAAIDKDLAALAAAQRQRQPERP